jgi:hypothetical protein
MHTFKWLADNSWLERRDIRGDIWQFRHANELTAPMLPSASATAPEPWKPSRLSV